VLRLFSDISNSNKRKVVNNNLGGFWKGKVVDYTTIQVLKAKKPSTSKADAMHSPHRANNNQQTTLHDLLIQMTTIATLFLGIIPADKKVN
jgi:hypothetical protein